MLNHFCKKPLWECTQTLAAVAQGRQPADTVITGARLVNVCTAEVQDDIDVAIAEGRIAYVGQSAAHCIGEGTRVIDAAGQVIAPGFLDRLPPRPRCRRGLGPEPALWSCSPWRRRRR